MSAEEFQPGCVHGRLRAFYRLIKAAAQDGRNLATTRLYRAKAGTDWQHEKSDATLRYLTSVSQTIVKSR